MLNIYIVFALLLVLLVLIHIVIISHTNNYYDPYKLYLTNTIDKNIDILKNTRKEDIIIPKIVHKIAPQDQSKWRPIWIQSHNSWLKYFPEPEYKIMMWNDDDIDNFIKDKYNWFYEIYINYPYNIQRFDIVRYFILYEYGGIYADMDYEIFKNFYNLIPNNKISIVENGNIFSASNSFLENSLMISPKNNHFWLDIIKLASTRFSRQFKHLSYASYIVYSTGPNLITDIYKNMKQKHIINILPKKLYNNKHFIKNNKNIEIIGMHHWTVSWMHIPKPLRPFLKITS
jgi:mannosyltransferase OCH1-like enzyme